MLDFPERFPSKAPFDQPSTCSKGKSSGPQAKRQRRLIIPEQSGSEQARRTQTTGTHPDRPSSSGGALLPPHTPQQAALRGNDREPTLQIELEQSISHRSAPPLRRSSHDVRASTRTSQPSCACLAQLCSSRVGVPAIPYLRRTHSCVSWAYLIAVAPQSLIAAEAQPST